MSRLIVARGAAPEPLDVTLVERAATTLALGRLLDHERESGNSGRCYVTTTPRAAS